MNLKDLESIIQKLIRATPEYPSYPMVVSVSCNSCPFTVQLQAVVQQYTGILTEGVPKELIAAAKTHKEAFHGISGQAWPGQPNQTFFGGDTHDEFLISYSPLPGPYVGRTLCRPDTLMFHDDGSSETFVKYDANESPSD